MELSPKIFQLLADGVDGYRDLPRPLGIGWGRLVSVLRRCQPSDEHEYLFRRRGAWWAFDLNRDGQIARDLFYKGDFEPESSRWVRENVGAGHHCLDVGANIGFFTNLLAQAVGSNGRVLAFEPTSHFRRLLERNVRLNSYAQVEVIPIGLSDRNQNLEISCTDTTAAFAPSHWKSSDGVRTELVCLTPLDDWAVKHELTRLDFVKVDIDGHEQSFVSGAEQTIRRLKPLLLIEMAPECHAQGRDAIRELVRTIEDLGYRFESTSSERLPGAEAILKSFDPKRESGINVVCRPK